MANYAVARTVAAHGKAFYTTPLKALSNQKFAELASAYGEEAVGLLTGDTAIRPHARIVVMTTEVLRNMLLAGSELLWNLRTVVLDEVHYLQDPYRGGVWEEVLVLCPPEVGFVCLSATVANATELGEWLRSVRGPTTLVVERRRPIVLRHHLAVFRRSEGQAVLLPLLDHGRPAEEGLRLDQSVRRRATRTRHLHGWQGARRPSLPVRAPRRVELIELLDDHDLLPAIVFIFSRAACDDAVRQCLRDGVRLTDRSERATIRRIAEAHVETLTDEDLRVLGFPEWCEGLESGLGAHHAGLVPAYRETVEECFAAGLLKVVFATETLSLGINMPARTVVLERFTKFGSAGRAPLTSGEYTQLTGRAGRRGLDAEGHAVVLWSPETPVGEMARVALAPPPDLRSAFRPTYNLAVNLVGRFDRRRALDVLRRSFAQWQATHTSTPPRRELLAEHLGRRLAVLEELGYVTGWQLTPAGQRLARIYHESDLLIAEALAAGVFDGAEPAVLAGVLSSVVFEHRRARRRPEAGHRRSRQREEDRATACSVSPGSKDRLGQRRREEVAQRLAHLQAVAERLRALEEVHLVPRTPQTEPALAIPVAAWVRGASFATALDLAAGRVGDLAPGDFVRTARQLADLLGQVSLVAPQAATAAAASAARNDLLRDVVAAGTLPAATEGNAESADD